MRNREDLRQLEEKILRWRSDGINGGKGKDFPKLSNEDILSLIEELTLQKVELGELAQVRKELEYWQMRYKELCDFLPIGYLTLDENATVVEANSFLAGLLKLERSQLINQNFFQFIAPAFIHEFNDCLIRLFQTGCSQKCNLQLKSHEGKTFSVTFTGKPVKNLKREVVLHVVIEVNAESPEDGDLRDQALANPQKTGLSHSFSPAFTGNIPLPAVLFDARGSIVRVNQSFENLTGFSSADLEGKSYPYPWSIKESYPDQYLEDISGFASQYSLKNDDGNPTIYVLKKDGTRKMVEVNAISIQNPGTPEYYLEIWIDVSEKEGLKRELKKVEITSLRLQRNFIVGVIIISVEGDILFVSDAFRRLMGYSSEELVGQCVADFITPEDRHGVMIALLRARMGLLENRIPKLGVTTRDGTILRLKANPKPVIINGTLYGFLVILRRNLRLNNSPDLQVIATERLMARVN